jgi:hypothetical protein
MSTILSELTIDTKLTDSASSIVESTANTNVFIGAAVFTNTSSQTETVTVWRLNSSGVADTTNYLAVKDILAGKTWQCAELTGQVISNESKIQASTTTDDAVIVNLSGTVSN